jgi:hypothetical protein
MRVTSLRTVTWPASRIRTPRWFASPSRIPDSLTVSVVGLIDESGTISPRGGRRPEGNPVSRWLSVK